MKHTSLQHLVSDADFYKLTEIDPTRIEVQLAAKLHPKAVSKHPAFEMWLMEEDFVRSMEVGYKNLERVKYTNVYSLIKDAMLETPLGFYIYYVYVDHYSTLSFQTLFTDHPQRIPNGWHRHLPTVYSWLQMLRDSLYKHMLPGFHRNWGGMYSLGYGSNTEFGRAYRDFQELHLTLSNVNKTNVQLGTENIITAIRYLMHIGALGLRSDTLVYLSFSIQNLYAGQPNRIQALYHRDLLWRSFLLWCHLNYEDLRLNGDPPKVP
jgi:hypothetical protein